MTYGADPSARFAAASVDKPERALSVGFTISAMHLVKVIRAYLRSAVARARITASSAPLYNQGKRPVRTRVTERASVLCIRFRRLLLECGNGFAQYETSLWTHPGISFCVVVPFDGIRGGWRCVASYRGREHNE